MNKEFSLDDLDLNTTEGKAIKFYRGHYRWFIRQKLPSEKQAELLSKFQAEKID